MMRRASHSGRGVCHKGAGVCHNWTGVCYKGEEPVKSGLEHDLVMGRSLHGAWLIYIVGMEPVIIVWEETVIHVIRLEPVIKSGEEPTKMGLEPVIVVMEQSKKFIQMNMINLNSI